MSDLLYPERIIKGEHPLFTSLISDVEMSDLLYPERIIKGEHQKIINQTFLSAILKGIVRAEFYRE